MSRYSLRLGRVFGVRITVDPSWFVVFGLLTWMLAVQTFAPEFVEWNTLEYWAAGAATALLFFLSVLLHEFGHALAAGYFKLPVRRVTLMMFGGVAEIDRRPALPFIQFWVALAGPAVNVALWAFFTILSSETNRPAVMMAAQYLAHINLILAAFNLIPGFPLDGGRVLQAVLWQTTRDLRRATKIAAEVGRWVGFATIGLGAWEIFSGIVFGGIWIPVSGWFLASAAQDQLHQPALFDPLATHPVAHAMTCRCPTVPADVTLQEMVDRRDASDVEPCFTVMEEGSRHRLAGVVTFAGIQALPRRLWRRTTAGSIMMRVPDLHTIAPDTRLAEALEEMDRRNVDQLPVTANGEEVGSLSRDDVITYLEALRHGSGDKG